MSLLLARSRHQNCVRCSVAMGGKADIIGSLRAFPLLTLPPSAIQSSCVAVFLFDQLVRAQQDWRQPRFRLVHRPPGLPFGCLAFCSFSRFALGLDLLRSLAFCLCGSLYLRDPGSFALCLLGRFALDLAGGFTLPPSPPPRVARVRQPRSSLSQRLRALPASPPRARLFAQRRAPPSRQLYASLARWLRASPSLPPRASPAARLRAGLSPRRHTFLARLGLRDPRPLASAFSASASSFAALLFASLTAAAAQATSRFAFFAAASSFATSCLAASASERRCSAAPFHSAAASFVLGGEVGCFRCSSLHRRGGKPCSLGCGFATRGLSPGLFQQARRAWQPCCLPP